MPENPSNDNPTRHALLPLVLFGVLVLSVLTAWALTITQGAAVRAGEKLLAELRDRGLEEFWPEARLDWLISRHRGRVEGWEARTRLRRPDDTYEGLELRATVEGDGLVGIWSHWALREDLSQSSYTAGTMRWSGGLPTLRENTRIEYQEGRVHVTQTLWTRGGRARQRSSGVAEDHYIPEGALPLVTWLTARRRIDSAHFELVLDDLPPWGTQTRFGELDLSYKGRTDDESYPGGQAVEMLITYPPTDMPRITVFNADGEVLGVLQGERERRSATLAEARDLTPECLRVLAGVARQRDYPLGAVLSEVYGEDADDLERQADPPGSISELRELFRRLLGRPGEAGSGDASPAPGE